MTNTTLAWSAIKMRDDDEKAQADQQAELGYQYNERLDDIKALKKAAFQADAKIERQRVLIDEQQAMIEKEYKRFDAQQQTLKKVLDLLVSADKKKSRLLEIAKSLLEWVDAVPADTVLPAMPGMDRDWVDTVIETEGEKDGTEND